MQASLGTIGAHLSSMTTRHLLTHTSPASPERRLITSSSCRHRGLERVDETLRALRHDHARKTLTHCFNGASRLSIGIPVRSPVPSMSTWLPLRFEARRFPHAAVLLVPECYGSGRRFACDRSVQSHCAADLPCCPFRRRTFSRHTAPGSASLLEAALWWSCGRIYVVC